MTSWIDHPLCASRDTMPSAFWGPEKLDSAAFVELVDLLSPDVEIPVRAPAGGAEQLAGTLARLHFAGHPRLAEMIAATTPLIGRTLALGSALSDDGVLLSARR